MKAIVLAGGFGTRIQPLTNSVPKPMLPILNRPMMEHIIIKLRDELDITEIGVLLYFKPDIIKDYFKDGSDLGVKIQYFLPDDDYGTAGAVTFAKEFLDETFIIVSGDLVTDFDFKKIKRFHNKKESMLTITLTSVENPLQFGVVIANEEDRIERFLEKPSWGEVFSDTINTGIYMIEPEVLDLIPYKENFDFAKDLFPKMMKQDIALWGYSQKGYWRDVGNPESYREVYKDIFSGKIKLPYKGEESKIDKGTVYAQKGVKLSKKIRVEGTVVLGKNVSIDEGVTLKDCVIGDNCRVSKHSEIIDSVLWNNVKIGVKVKLNNSVICNDNIIKDESKATFGVIMAEKCLVNKKVSFEKDIIMWPDKVLESSSVVSSNIIWGNKYKSSIFEDGAVLGRTNIELSCEMTTKLAAAFGSILPVGSSLYVSRDYHKSSFMLKRAFVSGILSTGVNIVDPNNVPSNVMRHSLSKKDDIAAGVHLRQSVFNPAQTEIIFFTNEGLVVDNKLAQSIERIFFRENFRKVKYDDIGSISEDKNLRNLYIKTIENSFDNNIFKDSELKVAIDVMNGSISDIYPVIANELGIDNIILNAYRSEKIKSNDIVKSQENMENIVRAMNLDCGFMIYPNGHKLQVIDDKGELIYDYKLLLVVLDLLDTTTTRKLKVILPAWAPDFINYDNIEVSREKLSNFKAEQLKEYDLIADSDGHFAFNEFGLNRDSVFTSFKILELLKKSGKKLSKLHKSIPEFYYKGENIPCPSSLKGKMMRKFLEDGKDKKTSSVDGVKIWMNDDEWILMVPDQHNEYLNLYVQAEDEKSAGKIFYSYQDKIEKWISE
ncbi:sugar phosphate nucleotidyltransferase [Halarcobacter anaerophilus]|uniref:Mannose-1-phosphate guanyltransferase n=1 Tax=Halarcobacter anaerophilus TaxID=877500 RepID=A0A4Q0Y0X0_9BACT|nr:sugar phosphate nucleotidyltransferase [Halarcobacter anaerophilus]QDF30166.1 UDP-N-acetylglucosamine diphosphorylase/glucosamine-1-phosphate N-acetyltransferase/GDP-mannose pyrophosphorylase [Halarcobacter anaerophilus]RXJ62269.1 mannose-1-phosphate guanyltransferase [Halarcobacter anaerophilus]